MCCIGCQAKNAVIVPPHQVLTNQIAVFPYCIPSHVIGKSYRVPQMEAVDEATQYFLDHIVSVLLDFISTAYQSNMHIIHLKNIYWLFSIMQ